MPQQTSCQTFRTIERLRNILTQSNPFDFSQFQVKAKAAEIEEAVYGPKAPPASSSPATTAAADTSLETTQIPPGIFLPDDVVKKSIEKASGKVR